MAAIEADVERELDAHRFGPEMPRGARLGNRFGEHPIWLVVLAAGVNPGLVRADGVRGDHDALEDHVRWVRDDVAVLRSARLRRLRVHNDVLWSWRIAVDGAHLGHGREAGPS